MKLTTETTKIGFIGTGVMGKSMASHLIKAGFAVQVFNRTKTKVDELLALGAVWKDSVAEVAANNNVIITMLGYPSDVEQVYLGAQGVVNNAVSGSYIIDMTTSSPILAKNVYNEASKHGVMALDAPVSGGDVGAKEARLTIMVGGDTNAFEDIKPIFKVMGTNIGLLGGPGAGQYTKMCNQIAIAPGMLGVAEALAYAHKAGLDREAVLKMIETGAAGSWSLSNYGPRMIAGNFAPGFYIKHFIKDMRIALESAKEMNLELPGLDLAFSVYEKLVALGEENSGTHALYKLYAGTVTCVMSGERG